MDDAADSGMRTVRSPPVRVVVRAVAWALVFAAPAAAAASWFTPRPELDEEDAVDTALGALEEVGIEGELDGPVVPSGHVPPEGGPLGVWVVFVDVDGERIELRVRTTAGQLVYVDDRIGPEEAERLLTDEQFETIGEYRNDATVDRWVLRNAVASVDAVLVAGAAFVIAKRSDRLWR
jgi:hypothetical protein